MPPVLEQGALAPLAPGGLIEQLLWITAKTGKQRQVMGAHQGVDRIDLQQAQALDLLIESGGLDRCRRLAPAEALGSQRQPAGLLERERR